MSLPPCPTSPNCVCSDADDARHRVAPFALIVPTVRAWPSVAEAVEALPRTRIVERTAESLHAECRSAVFGFVDDLHLELRAADGTVAVRSASRVGHSDFGVNRRRVESLRGALAAAGIVSAAEPR